MRSDEELSKVVKQSERGGPEAICRALYDLGQLDALKAKDERQRFIDEAATQFAVALLQEKFELVRMGATAEAVIPSLKLSDAYNMAEALWIERKRRRKGGENG